MLHNITAGVILSDQSLVLQSLKKEKAGDYSCQAANVEGTTTSNVVTLRIQCEEFESSYDIELLKLSFYRCNFR